MITSVLYGEKLRIWSLTYSLTHSLMHLLTHSLTHSLIHSLRQALCVLSTVISEGIATTILEEYMVILTHICVPSIRVHLEIFGAALVTRFPALVLPRILRELESFNHVYQVLSSYFIILGHYVMNIIQSKTALNPSIVVEIINILIPWCSLTRTYLLTHSCLLTYSLITYSLTFTHSPFTHSLTHSLFLTHLFLTHSSSLTSSSLPLTHSPT
jgi:hypothetical protein